jgi:hypothetical protein
MAVPITGHMGNVPRPLLGLLVATVAFFALWIVALKPSPSSSSTGSGKQGLGAYQADIKAAKKAVGLSASTDARVGGSVLTTPTIKSAQSPTRPSATTSSTASHSTARSHPASTSHTTTVPHTAAGRLAAVDTALSAHKVVALLFYNPSAPDDMAVKQELASISIHKGQVLKLAVPLGELPSYTVVITQVPVNFSPALVIIDRARQASEITGFADTYQISQAIDDALAVAP